jgi:hypothetical protein
MDNKNSSSFARKKESSRRFCFFFLLLFWFNRQLRTYRAAVALLLLAAGQSSISTTGEARECWLAGLRVAWRNGTTATATTMAHWQKPKNVHYRCPLSGTYGGSKGLRFVRYQPPCCAHAAAQDQFIIFPPCFFCGWPVIDFLVPHSPGLIETRCRWK